MKELKFKSQICTTIEQSKRLLELGLKAETADMCHHLSNPQDQKNPYTKLALDDYIYIHLGEEGWEDTIPAWSLHRLIELYTYKNAALYYMIRTPNSFDGVINDIAKRIENKYFNKEYLK